MANFVGRHNANDTFIGTTAADTFTFAPADLTSGDTVNGGSGTAIDTLVFSATGAVTASSLTHVSAIERINLYAGGNSLSFGDAFALANAPSLAIFGGAGNDIVDASTVTRADRGIDVTAGGGTDTIRGGAGNDIARFALADLTTADTVAGNGGRNTLHLTGGGTVAVANLTHVTGMQTIMLDGASRFTLTDALIKANGLADSSGNLIEQVVGSTGADTIDGSGLTDTHDRLYINGGLGADILKGGAASDLFLYTDAGAAAAGEVIDGGGGGNAINVSADNDFTKTTISHVSGLVLSNATVTMTVQQILGFSAIQAATPGASIERLRIADNIATLDLNALRLQNFDAHDQIVVTGDASAQTIVARLGLLTSIDAGGGNDVIRSAGGYGGGYGAGAQIQGGDGDDRIDYDDAAGTRIDGGSGNDTLTAIGFIGGGIVTPVTIRLASIADQSSGDQTILTGFENVDWSAMDPSSYRPLNIIGDTGANRILGGAGNDVIDGAGGADVIDGGGGADRITYRSDGVSIAGGAGTDLLILPGSATVDLNAADQTIGDGVLVTGFEGVDASSSTTGVTITGNNAGYGTIVGSSTADHLIAGASGDELIGGRGNDVLTGSNANDVFRGGIGRDTMIGGGGGDIFYLDKGDYIQGESIVAGGDDGDQLHMDVGAVADFTTGTLSGLQFIVMDGSTDLTVKGSQIVGVDQIFDTAGTTVEHLTIDLSPGVTTDFSQMQVTGFGSEDVITLNASSGNDSVVLPEGVTTFHGLGGNDTIGFNQNYYGFSAGSQIYGDDGNDRIQYLDGTASVTTILDGGTGSDTLVDNVNDAWMTYQIDLSKTADQTIGDYATVTGFENVDWSGSSSSLNVKGDSGANRLVGGYGADTIDGGAGNDILQGGPSGTATDTLTGGTGADTFILELGTTRITDFNASEGDVLGFDNTSLFHFNHATPTRVVASSNATHIAGADLVIYTGGVLNDSSAAQAWFDSTDGGTTQNSMFLVGKDGGGDTLLFYTPGGTGFVELADLGKLTAPTAITTGMFHFGV